MFTKTTSIFVGVAFAGMGLLIAIEGGFIEYGYYRDYGEFATPAGTSLIIIGVVITYLGVSKKKTDKHHGSSTSERQSDKGQ